MSRPSLPEDPGKEERAEPGEPSVLLLSAITDGSITEGRIKDLYRSQGLDLVNELNGPFAAVISDPVSGIRYGIRDRIGLVPLYYSTHGGGVRFGSSISSLIEPSKELPTLNTPFIAELFAGTVRSLTDTVFEGIYRVPPGSIVTVAERDVSTHRYFDPSELAGSSKLSTGDALEALRNAIAASVRNDIKYAGQVGCFLSGGMDSLSVFAAAREAASQGGSDPSAVINLSLSFQGLSCDEAAALEALRVQFPDLQAPIPWKAPSKGHFLQQSRESLSICDYFNSVLTQEISKRAAGFGISTVLTGLGGDELCAVPLPWYRDLRGRDRLSRLVPTIFKRWIKKFAPSLESYPPWLKREFIADTNLAERTFRSFLDFDEMSSREFRLTMAYTNPHSVIAREITFESARLCGLELRHPLLSEEIVKIAYALPDKLFSRSDPKRIIREALCGMIPEDVLASRTKADFTPTFFETADSIKADIGAFFSHSPLLSDWISNKALQQFYEDAHTAYLKGNIDYAGRRVFELWAVFAVGILLHVFSERQKTL